MCRFFKKCNRTCRNHKSHFRHWEHVRKYAQKKDSAFLNYRTYTRLSKNNDLGTLLNNNHIIKNKESNFVNYAKYENYLVTNMIKKIIYDIIHKI